jgi:hypothetical protein
MNAQAGTNNMTAIQKQVSQYTDLSDWFAKGLGIIVRDKTKDRFGRTAAQRRTDKFLQTVQDSFLPVGRMIKEMKDRGLTIMDAIDPYLKQQLSRSVSGARIEERKRGIYKNMQEAIKGLTITDANRESLIKASRSKATKGDGLAAHIFDLSGSNSLAVAEIYLYAKHALERNEYVRKIDVSNQSGSGMTDAEANAILNWFSSNLSQQNRSAIAQIEAAAKAIVADTNKVRVDGNLIPAQLVNLTTDGSTKPKMEAPSPTRRLQTFRIMSHCVVALTTMILLTTALHLKVAASLSPAKKIRHFSVATLTAATSLRTCCSRTRTLSCGLGPMRLGCLLLI